MPRTLTAQLDSHLDTVTARRGALGQPQVLVRSPRLDYSYGDTTTAFHAASVGKLMTAVLVMQLAEAGRLSLDTPITALLPAAELAGLFTIDGTDHAAEVTVEQLLSHTSGIADYFEGKTLRGPNFTELLVSEPDRFWSPAELLDFSRERQRPVGTPGERFLYSNTGYVLLGRAIEELHGAALESVLASQLFAPLGMDNSWLVHRSTPASGVITVMPFWLDKTNVTDFLSVSCDWAGGGIAATPADLATFSVALHTGTLLSQASVDILTAPRHRFHTGLHYGAGMMEVRFGEFSPFLRRFPRPVGHIGILATHLFYDAENDAHIVLNFGSTREMSRSFRTLIRIEQVLRSATKTPHNHGTSAKAIQ